MPIFSLALILVSAFFHAANSYFTKKSKNKVVFIWWTFFLFSISLSFLLPKGIHEGYIIFSFKNLIVCSLAAIFFALFFNLSGLAYQAQDLSLIFPLTSTGPLYIPLLAIIFLGEEVTKMGIIGVLFVCLGSYLITFEKLHLSEFSRPGKFIKERGVYCALAAGFFYALGAIFDKIGVTLIPVLIYTYIMMLIMTVFFSLNIFRKKYRDDVLLEWKINKKNIILGTINLILSTYTYRYGLSMCYVSYAASLRLTSVFIGVLFGIIILKEGYSSVRLISSTFIVAGVSMIKFLS